MLYNRPAASDFDSWETESVMKAGDPRILSLYSRRCAENRAYTDSFDESCSCGRPKPTRSTPLEDPWFLRTHQGIVWRNTEMMEIPKQFP